MCRALAEDLVGWTMIYVGPRRGSGLVVAGLFLVIFGGTITYLYWKANHEVSGAARVALAGAVAGVVLIVPGR
jgi:hypothetical protein